MTTPLDTPLDAPHTNAMLESPEPWRRIDRVIDQLLDHDRSEWPALIASACGDDIALRSEVERLLANEQRAGALLESGPGAIAAQMVSDIDDERASDVLVGTRLGAWLVDRQIGRGGMSRVFLGHRVDGAFDQRVAIKVLRAGLDTDADFERFRIERQILASLEHPYIARLFDGGVTSDGRPYLVLEYIEGEPLTAYCDARTLDIPTRLRLFLSVAEATQSAHRQLVVHRDLKPANILVGADGRPRLLDFGIAKIVDPAGVGASDHTATRRRWYTPEYAAPEQFTGAPVTTATDVYQLGVVLYELLSGQRPFTGGGAASSLEERVRDDDAAAPSTHRGALRGDIDAVILKAMRKEPHARYASVADFAADVQRVLDREPVHARIGDRAYRWRRTLRRRAVPLTLAAAGTLAAIVYVSTLVVQNRRVTQALATATLERQTSEQVTAFLLGLFEASDPRAGRTDTMTVRALLAKGEQNADSLSHTPAVHARLLDMIGSVRANLGAFAEARTSFDRALAIRRRLHGEEHADVALSIAHLATLDKLTNRFEEAERGYRAALAQQQRLLGDSADATQETRFQLATLLHSTGRMKDAGPMFAEWESISRAQPGARDAVYARHLSYIGEYTVASARGDTTVLARAERQLREALAIQRRLIGPVHADLARTSWQLASLLYRLDRGPEADSLFRDALQALRVMYPKGDVAVVGVLSEFGLRLVRSSRAAEGLPLMHEAAQMARVVHGDSDVMTGAAIASYGGSLRIAGRHADAERVLREALVALRPHGGGMALMSSRVRTHLGDVLSLQGRHAEAEPLLRGEYEQLAARRGVADVQSQYALDLLVRFYERTGNRRQLAHYRPLVVARKSPPVR